MHKRELILNGLLRPENAEAAYSAAGRPSRAGFLARVRENALQVAESLGQRPEATLRMAMETFLSDLLRELAERGRLPKEEERIGALLHAVECLLGLWGDQGGDMLERVFSIRCYGDS